MWKGEWCTVVVRKVDAASRRYHVTFSDDEEDDVTVLTRDKLRAAKSRGSSPQPRRAAAALPARVGVNVEALPVGASPYPGGPDSAADVIIMVTMSALFCVLGACALNWLTRPKRKIHAKLATAPSPSSSLSSSSESDDDQRPLRVGEKVCTRAYACGRALLRAYARAYMRVSALHASPLAYRPLHAGEGYVEGRVVHRSCAEGRRCQ